MDGLALVRPARSGSDRRLTGKRIGLTLDAAEDARCALLGWFGARRICAEQETLGSQPEGRARHEGVTAMAKNVFFRMTKNHPVALGVGWAAFLLGLIVNPIIPRLLLLSAARVLPRAIPFETLARRAIHAMR